MTKQRYQWAAPGDVNAFFGLMLDNVADLVLTIGLLHLAFGFPTNFALTHMVPGTAIGVLIGDLCFFFMALKLARRTGRNSITAMPLGLDTPSTIGMVLFVLGPAFLAKLKVLGLPTDAGRDPAYLTDPKFLEAAQYTWHIGICAIVISGVFKFACALGSGWVRKLVPRAGLLGSLTAIALVLISFLPFIEVLHYPIVGFAALAVILTTLVARVQFPWRIPGALAAVLVAGSIYYLMLWTGTLGHTAETDFDPTAALLPYDWFAVFRSEWRIALKDSLQYMPIVIPFALGTVVGGIDCVESAAAAGDEYDTNAVIGVEAFATLVAGLCGGVIQTTPYIGHPAYKAMGGRAAYTLATALFVGGAGLLGYFAFLYLIIPKATVFPILIFIGLEITAQSFQATPKKHYPAVALACVPAMAALVVIYLDSLFGELMPKGITAEDLSEKLQLNLLTVRVLSAGFIVTSLLWASMLAAIIDRKLAWASIYCFIAGVCALFGVIHSPLPGSPVALPWSVPESLAWVPIRYAIGYAVMGVLLLVWSYLLPRLDDNQGDAQPDL